MSFARIPGNRIQVFEFLQTMLPKEPGRRCRQNACVDLPATLGSSASRAQFACERGDGCSLYCDAALKRMVRDDGSGRSSSAWRHGMSTVANSHRSRLANLRDLIFRRPLPLAQETVLFVLVSALDLFMTCILLHRQVDGGGHYYESNPVAGYFLQEAGLRGMVYFKFTMVGIVATVVQAVALERLTVARRLFEFATLAGCAVVLYSFSLLLQHTSYF